jgi:hypothetical protein
MIQADHTRSKTYKKKESIQSQDQLTETFVLWDFCLQVKECKKMFGKQIRNSLMAPFSETTKSSKVKQKLSFLDAKYG